ncbi:MAG: class I SAM-dependent methyltransferase [Verrucomicrobiota bacterium]
MQTVRRRREIQNQRSMKERDALFQRFGYDSAASLRFVLSKIRPLSGHVLEIGTGKGRFLAAMAKHVERITTLDVDAEQQRAAKLHVRRPSSRCPIRFIVHDAERLPWPGAVFDTVVSVNTFHHLSHPLRVFNEMLRVLKPGGKLVLCDLSPRGFQIFDRIHRFEGGTHPRLRNGLTDFARLLRDRGWTTKRFKGCNQEILVSISRTNN